jgi:predicted site-specific integrase-resolvase
MAIANCRVSSAAQKPDLKNQRRVLEQCWAARGVANIEYIGEVVRGLNFRRPRFVALMDRIEGREVSHLVIAHKDRLVRFGFQWFDRCRAEHGTD